ncbi:hypothetical protein N0V86_006541 [Didymella sp. IMI 355093]|nr:hypothetical protein N0V86_006541 [Didymella sp. IMI 355093]
MPENFKVCTYDSTRRKEKAEAKPKPGGSRRAKAESKNQPISENDRESEVEEDNPGYDVSPGGVQSIPTALPTVEAEVEEHSLFELPPGDIQGIQPEFYCSSREALSALYPFSMEKEEELVPYVFDPPIVSLQQVEVEPEFTLSLEEQDAICRWFDFDAYYSDIPLAAAPLPPLTVPASGGVQSDAPLAVCVGTKRALEDAEDMSTLSKRRVPKETQES